jgi:hypothetical protein
VSRPCDLRFGLSSTAAHTSRWASGVSSGGARPRSGRRAKRLAPGSTNDVGGADSSGAGPQKSEWGWRCARHGRGSRLGAGPVGCRSSLRHGMRRHDGVRDVYRPAESISWGDQAKCWGS